MLVNINFWEQPPTSFVEVINVFLAVLDDNALIGTVHLLAREITDGAVCSLGGLHGLLAILDDDALVGCIHLLAREIIGRTVSALRGLNPLNTSVIGLLKQLYLFEDSGTYDPTPTRV